VKRGHLAEYEQHAPHERHRAAVSLSADRLVLDPVTVIIAVVLASVAVRAS
jgi:hypothetical protein